jgi:hypothetical protein
MTGRLVREADTTPTSTTSSVFEHMLAAKKVASRNAGYLASTMVLLSLPVLAVRKGAKATQVGKSTPSDELKGCALLEKCP